MCSGKEYSVFAEPHHLLPLLVEYHSGIPVGNADKGHQTFYSWHIRLLNYTATLVSDKSAASGSRKHNLPRRVSVVLLHRFNKV